MFFYRVVQIEDNFEVVKVIHTTEEHPLLFGKFISNSLLVVGNQQGLQLATIGHRPSPLLPLNLDKFSYIDFFIEEEGM